MSSISTDAFPELRGLLWQRDQEIGRARHSHHVDAASDNIGLFWQELATRIEKDDEINNVLNALSEAHSDIDLLRGLRDRALGSKEPEARLQVSLLERLIQLLLTAESALQRRLAVLRERAFQYYLLYNFAMPSKVDEKMNKDKDKDKNKEKEVRRALDDKRPEAKKVDQRPQEKREKKVEA